MAKYLFLDLDEFYTQGYYYTQFDIGGAGHSILIEAENRIAFLDAFADEWRKLADAALQDWDNEQDIE